MSERRSSVVSALLIISLLLRLAVLAAGLGLIGWLFFSVLERDLAASLIVFPFVFLVLAASFYVGVRLRLKHRRRSQQALEEYRERMRAKRGREEEPGEGPESPS